MATIGRKLEEGKLERRFIESVRFPFQEISEASGGEKRGGGRPPHWEMVFWWTRKPLISARAVIAGSLLPEDTDRRSFLHWIGFYKGKSPHQVNPTRKFNGNLLDPFAGFGSIPLEALRLGLNVTAVELLPVAYVFLKAVLEYPVRYGHSLITDVERWGNWVTERLKEDPIIKELYDEDIAVYIGSWEVKCPSCHKWTPLVGNWWLARVKGRDGYERLAWMKPKVEGDRVEVEVVDLSKVIGDRVKGAKVEANKVKVGEKEYVVPDSNVEARREQATCLYCSQPIRFIEPESGRHIVKPELGEVKQQKLVWYVKYALSKYNEGDESLAKPRLLVKVKLKERDLEFTSCIDEDIAKLWKAKEEIEKLLEKGDPDIPTEGIALYENRRITPILGITKWHKFFNPRQLLTLVKLTKLIREAGKRVEEEKLSQGWSREEAFKYAETVIIYLAIAQCKLLNYNSITTRWDSTWWKIGETLSTRGIAMNWNWCDINPIKNFIGSWIKSLNSSINGLEYLVSAIGGDGFDFQSCKKEVLNGEAKVFLDDAIMLNKLDSEEKFDLIVTDPPYYDDVPYAELSDFYYVWLKRALSDVDNGRLKPRFLREAFFEEIGEDWVEIPTQWERYALNEVSLNPPRLGPDAKMEDGIKHFQNLLNASFITMASRLKDEGLLVTYYAHTDPDAWKALLEAGWEAAGLRVTNAFPMTTESAQSVVKRGKLSMDTSIIVTWRKGVEGSIDASDLYKEMVEEASRRAKELIDLGIVGRDLLIGSLAVALGAATRYREVRVMGKIDVRTLVDKYVYPATLLGIARALARKAELKEGVRSNDSLFYLIVKFTLGGAKKKVLESTDARIFSIGTSMDLNMALKSLRILRAGKEEAGAKVAKAKTLILVEPASTERSKLAELLEARGVGISEPKIRCAVDALHVLEYYAITYSRDEFKRKLDELKARYPAQVIEALSMARIMARVLPDTDVEKGLCNRVVGYLEPGGLTPFMEGES